MWYLTEDGMVLYNIDPMCDERFEIEPFEDGFYDIMYYNAAEESKCLDIIDGLDRAKLIIKKIAENLDAINLEREVPENESCIYYTLTPSTLYPSYEVACKIPADSDLVFYTTDGAWTENTNSL